MSFVLELTNRIKKLIGLNHLLEDDLSFFQPGGNDHLAQFFLKSFCDEYWELEAWDRHNLLLMELAAATDIEFVLDEDARFATLVEINSKGVKTIQAVVDLRDEYLAVVYYFGDYKACSKLNRKLFQTSSLHPCYVNSTAFIKIAGHLEKVTLLQCDFEQLPSMFSEPLAMKGVWKGELANGIFSENAAKHHRCFNVDSLAGYIADGARGTMVFSSDGSIKVDTCRLSTFLEMANLLFLILRERYEKLSGRYIVQWNEMPTSSLLRLDGNLIQIPLANPIDRIEGLIDVLSRGGKALRLIGVTERVSRKMWNVKTTELDSFRSLEFDVTDAMIRVFLGNKDSIPLFDKVESFIRRHICAEFEIA